MNITFDPAALKTSLVELFFDQMPVGVALFDREFHLVRCNTTWATLLERYTGTPASAVKPGCRLWVLL